MRAWKHHLKAPYLHSQDVFRIGAGAGGAVFLDYDKMLQYLKQDSNEYEVAEIEVALDELRFDYGNDWMATILVDRFSSTGFQPIDW
jgi:hypothetical protein